MKLTLLLMRHAKSSWGNPGLADHDRPLNQRGLRSGFELGSWLRENKYLPDEALVSSARRTQETFKSLNITIDPTIKRELFHSSSEELLDAISAATGETLLVIAHNPGIGDLALRLARMMRDHPDHHRFEDYPTGATFIIEYEASSWSNLDFSTGKIKDFIIPRELY